MRAILTWHSIDPSGSPISLPRQLFERQVDWLTALGVRVVSVPELAHLVDDVDAVALTFDDGFANFATDAMPVLQERGLPATLFVVTDHVGGDNRWSGQEESGIPVLPLLDWDALGRLRELGLVLGAHSMSHPKLPALSTEALHAELSGAANVMEARLGARPDVFAYPYGAVDERVSTAAALCYRWACTTDFRPLRREESALLLPRLDAWYFRAPDRFREWGAPGMRAWIWSRRQRRRAGVAMRRLRHAAS